MSDQSIKAITNMIVQLHDLQIENFGGSAGIRDYALLESAVGRGANAVFFDDSLDIIDMAAIISHGIMKNHPFVDANKRTALHTMEGIIRKYGLTIASSDDEASRAYSEFASSQDGPEALSQWIRNRLVFTKGCDFSKLKEEQENQPNAPFKP